MSRARARVVAIAVLVVAGVGVADAAWIREWDLVALFGAIAVLAAALALPGAGRRRPLSARADLAAWVADRARRTAHPPEAVVDQALAAYRRTVEPDRTGEPVA